MKNLCLADLNQNIVISRFCQTEKNKNKLIAMNFGVGSVIRLLQKHKKSLIIGKGNTRLVISNDIASKIFIN